MWQPCLTRGTAPAGRVSHTATLVDEDLVLIIGGGAMGVGATRDSEGAWRMFRDVHVLDCRTMEWNCVVPEECSQLPARRGDAAP